MSSTFLKITKSGHFKAGGDLKRAIEQIYGPALRRAGLILEGGMKREAPVRTGNLRRSVNTDQPRWAGAIYSVRIGPNAIYASRVNRVGRSRGYVKRGIDGSKARATAELKQARAALSDLWVGD